MELIRHLASYADELGSEYLVRAYGKQRPDTRWEGWIAFFPLESGKALSTDPETAQSDRVNLVNWATTLGPREIQAAFGRAHRLRPHDSDKMIRFAEIT